MTDTTVRTVPHHVRTVPVSVSTYSILQRAEETNEHQLTAYAARNMTEREKDDDSLTEKDGVKQSRRPVDTAIRQQRMKSWQPILDPFFVIVGLFVLGVVFVATGKYP